jgi:hypothetical protein
MEVITMFDSRKRIERTIAKYKTGAGWLDEADLVQGLTLICTDAYRTGQRSVECKKDPFDKALNWTLLIVINAATFSLVVIATRLLLQ